MNGDYGLSDVRFAGYSNEQLANQVDGLRNGQGAESLHNAARALVTLAGTLGETDRVLRQELEKIGVAWQGAASEGGTQATRDASIYASEAVGPVGDSAAGVATQSGSFSHTRNSAPDSGTLRGPTELNGWDRFFGAFGHTTDHAQEVRDTAAARDQAVAGLDGYQRSSSEALGRARALPVPPGMDLVTREADPSTSVSGVSAGGAGSPGPGGSGAPGPATGNPPGVPGGGPAGPTTGPGVPGPGVPGPAPGGPGATTGIGPTPPPLGPGLPTTTGGQGGPRPVPSLFIPAAAALAGAGAGGAALGANAEKDRLVRGKPGTTAEKLPPKGATPLGTPPDDEARAARNAERFGAKQGRPVGGSFMHPAAGAARREEDATHVRKYGIDSGDVFEDERLTAPALIGEDEDAGQKRD
jgi:hypothetical protein